MRSLRRSSVTSFFSRATLQPPLQWAFHVIVAFRSVQLRSTTLWRAPDSSEEAAGYCRPEGDWEKKLWVEEMIDKSQRSFKSCLIFILKAVWVFTDQHGPHSFNYFAVDNLFSFSCLRGWAWEWSQQVYIFYGWHLPFHYMHRLLSPQLTVKLFSFFRAIAQRGYTSLPALQTPDRWQTSRRNVLFGSHCSH